MFTQSIVKSARPATRLAFSSRAAFSTTTRTMAGGDTGAPRAQGDAFTKREKAGEDYAIREREKEKLNELKRKLAEQHEHLTKMQENIKKLEQEGDRK